MQRCEQFYINGHWVDPAERRLASGAGNADFLRTKLVTARFYAEQILPRAQMHAEAVQAGAAAIMALDAAQFA